ncbi:MAG: phage Gp37/Gp68 family protein [Sulfurovaceae bacterium]|nr:phage Gp37/Gp68 family protein [Sulfurovaceae bacterium]
MSKSKIEWTEATWNPVSGCDKISDGCKNCYAEKMAKRLQAMGTRGYENGFAVTLHPDRLDEPTKRKKPTMYFVCSMGDLFHDDVPFEFIDDIFATMIHNSHHTFQILTKRPERMKQYFERPKELIEEYFPNGVTLPAPNIWLGVTAENQEQADIRIPLLLDTPAHKRFVSIEPMIGKIDLKCIINDYAGIRTQINSLTEHKSIGNADFLNIIDCQKIDWVICGGETGVNARPMHPHWVRSLRDQCQDTKTPFFFKQWGEWAFEMPTSYQKEPTLYMNT